MATILITGANRGIGLALTKEFISHGHDVIATARDPSSADELKATGATVKWLDVSDPVSIATLKADIGDQPIDYLINNAGISGKSGLGELDYDEFAHVLNVNTLSPMRMIEAFTDNVAASNCKVIASVSSIMGSIASTNSAYGLVYRTSKAALNMALKSATSQLAEKGITVLALHPGWVQTDMGGQQAPVKPDESAAGLYKVITGAGTATELRFYDYEGSILPW